MLVIGLHGWFLHPIAILLCDMVVYAEFLIHPVVLLSTSTKLRHLFLLIKHQISCIIILNVFDFFFCRKEIVHTLKRLGQDIVNTSVTEVYWFTKTLLSCRQSKSASMTYTIPNSDIRPISPVIVENNHSTLGYFTFCNAR